MDFYQIQETYLPQNNECRCIYREAVMTRSPGLPRFAATLGQFLPSTLDQGAIVKSEPVATSAGNSSPEPSAPITIWAIAWVDVAVVPTTL